MKVVFPVPFQQLCHPFSRFANADRLSVGHQLVCGGNLQGQHSLFLYLCLRLMVLCLCLRKLSRKPLVHVHRCGDKEEDQQDK